MGDRLRSVIRQRKLREDERLVALAEAERRRQEVREQQERAVRAAAAARAPLGAALGARALVAHRLQGLALQDQVEQAHQAGLAADRAVDRAQEERVAAAVARRSVERLQERREQAASQQAERRLRRREEEAALHAWRRP